MLSRRRTIKLLSRAGLAGALATVGTPLAASTTPQYRWILLYWMPYDNDLSRYASEILMDLVKGVISDQILVLVQADTVNQATMTRYVISADGVQSVLLPASNSASPAVFSEFLSWAAECYVSAHWMLSVVGHGGRLTQLSPDDGEPGGRQWLDIRDMRDAISNFNQAIGQTLDLFFFQNCNKAALVPCYTLASVAQYTLASQDLLGAPNRYYLPLLRWLARTGQATGRSLAHRIRAYETEDMYLSYTVIDNRRLRSGLAAALNPLIDELWHRPWDGVDLNELVRLRYFGETYVDLVQFLALLAQQIGVDRTYVQQFTQFLNQTLDYLPNPAPTQFTDFSRVYVVRHRAEIETLYGDHLTGLSLHLPETQEQLQAHDQDNLYADLALPALLGRLLKLR